MSSRRHTPARAALGWVIVLAAVLGCSHPAPKPLHPEIAIRVTEDGFVPREAVAPRGVPVTLVVTRETDQTCATEMVVAGIDKKWDLPLGRPVRIEIPAIADTLHYICGMGMERGVVIAK